ncbi:hypothetical protein [Arthrobacter sp. UYCu712]|uniref:hypothetical protein n=1 Tax=Arthrobacter sp. UYCu712 TaxID=3156340 RepID=UPI0033924148
MSQRGDNTASIELVPQSAGGGLVQLQRHEYRLAMGLRYLLRLGYRMTVPSTFSSWWRQRLAWAGGEFRLYVVNIRFGRWHPYFWIYGTVFLFAFFFLRWAAILQPGWSLLAAGVMYFGMVYAVHWKHRNRWLLRLPFYPLVTSLILLPLGAGWYFAMSIPEKNFGLIRFRRPRYGPAAAGQSRMTAPAEA